MVIWKRSAMSISQRQPTLSRKENYMPHNQLLKNGVNSLNTGRLRKNWAWNLIQEFRDLGIEEILSISMY